MSGKKATSFPGAAKRVTFFIEYKGELVDPSIVEVEFGRCVEHEKLIDPLTLETLVYGIDDIVQRLSTGVYEVEVDPTRPGWWGVRLIASGSYVGAFEVYFRVADSHFVAA